MRVPQSPKQDRGAIFDTALTSGRLKLPAGISPEAARAIYVEHAATEWTDKDFHDQIEFLRDSWRRQKNDPRIQEMGRQIGKALKRAHAMADLDAMPLLWCKSALLHEKIIEALCFSLEKLKNLQKRREETDRKREFAESEVQDANFRMGLWPEVFKVRKSAALEILEEIQKEEDSDRRLRMDSKGIMDDLALALFAIIRHVTPASGLDQVSDRRIHAEAITPIWKAFAKLDSAIPKRISGSAAWAGDPGGVQAAPAIRLTRHLQAESRESKIAAEIWRDGRQILTRRELVKEARFRLFTWDSRFKPALFQNR